MHVLHLVSGNLFGGVESMLVAMARYSQYCPEMTQSFGVCFDGRLRTELEQSGAPVHCLGAVQVSRTWTLWRARRRLQELLDRHRFDWMICHSVWPLVVFGPVLQRHAGWLGFWQHDRVSGRHWLERWARLRTPRLAICNSHFTAETLPNLFPQTPPYVVCYPAVSGPRQERKLTRDRVRQAMNVSPEAVVLIQVSRMEPWKGHTLHLEALGRLRDIDNWVCWQVGGPQRSHEVEYFQALQALAKQLGIDNRIKFLGQRTDVPELLAAADIHCQPNTGPEPFGLTFIEAMYAGLPVVTTDMGGAAEILDGSCAHLVPPGDARALAEALHLLIGNRRLREQMGKKGGKRAESIADPRRRLPQLLEALQAHSLN